MFVWICPRSAKTAIAHAEPPKGRWFEEVIKKTVSFRFPCGFWQVVAIQHNYKRKKPKKRQVEVRKAIRAIAKATHQIDKSSLGFCTNLSMQFVLMVYHLNWSTENSKKRQEKKGKANSFAWLWNRFSFDWRESAYENSKAATSTNSLKTNKKCSRHHEK